MKKTDFRKHAAADLPAAFLLLLILLLVVMVHRFQGAKIYTAAVDPFFLMQPENCTTEVIDDFAGVQRSYTFTIQHEEAVRRGASLYAWLHHTCATVLLDGELYYDNLPDGSAQVGRTPGNYWLTVPFREEYLGKSLTITLTPVYSSVRDEEPQFFQISRDSLLSMILLPQDLTQLLLAAIAVTAGLFMIPLALALPIGGEDKRKIVYLGAVNICAGVWKLSSLQLLLLLLDRYGWQRQIWFLGSACYLLMLVLSLRLLGLLRTGGENRISRLCFYLGAGTAALLVLLQLAGAAELHDVLVGYGFFMAVLHLVSLLGEKPNRQELLWLLPTFLALGLDLLILLQPNSSIRNAPFFLCWILLNLFIRGFGLIGTAIRREQLLRLREEELREAKVRVMINQIQPHFIYNTLVSVYVLCEDDPRRAMEVVKNFTAFLQANFTAITAQELIAFPEELEHTRAYLGVEQVLLEDRLQVEYDTPFTAFRLPPMTLQPVVENAVKYGVKGRKEPGRITIRSFSAEDAAVVTVEDDGPGFDPDTLEGSGHVGLQNVRERLRMMCGGTLDIRSAPGLGTIVSIRIPNGREEQT